MILQQNENISKYNIDHALIVALLWLKNNKPLALIAMDLINL